MIGSLIEPLFDRYHYGVVFFLMMAGLFLTIEADKAVKRLMGLSIFQTSIFLFYIALGKVAGGSAPILEKSAHAPASETSLLYANPLPHVLILTAIVVGVATLAVGLTLIVRMHRADDTPES